MKKTYIQPTEETICLETAHQLLSGSANIKISKDPVDHFDSNRKTEDSHPIWH